VSAPWSSSTVSKILLERARLRTPETTSLPGSIPGSRKVV
jgi:hypothetical protein